MKLEIFQNSILDSELDFLRQKFDELKQTTDFPFKAYLNIKGSILFESGNFVVGEEKFSDEGKYLNWERIKINEELRNYVRQILTRVISDLDDDLTFYFVRSHSPLRIHLDGTDFRQKGKTMIIPLTFNENIHTVVWQQDSTVVNFEAWMKQFYQDPKKFKPSKIVPADINLKHCCVKNDSSFLQALDYDGSVAWKKGTIMSFGRMQYHASSNFKLLNDFKDFVLIHSEKIID